MLYQIRTLALRQINQIRKRFGVSISMCSLEIVQSKTLNIQEIQKLKLCQETHSTLLNQ